MIKKILSFIILILIVSALFITSVSAENYKDIINSNLEYFKTNFKESFESDDIDKIETDVWYLYPLYHLDKLQDPQFQFMIPNYEADEDLSELGAGDLAKRVMANAILNKPIESYVKELTTRQLEDGSFTNSFGFAQITDTVWSITALQIAMKNEINFDYDYNKAIEFLQLNQLEDGGFNDFDTVGSVDTTGMVMIALSIVNTNETKSIAENCISFLQSVLNENAFFVGKGAWDSANSCSQSYAIIGLLAAGEDVFSAKWTKNKINIVDALLSFQGENGGFWYDLDSKEGNGFFSSPDYYSSYTAMLALCDLEYSNLWIKLAQIPQQATTTSQPTTVTPTNLETTTEAETTSKVDTTTEVETTTNNNTQLNANTGEKPLNPIIIVALIVAVILMVAAVLMKNKK